MILFFKALWHYGIFSEIPSILNCAAPPKLNMPATNVLGKPTMEYLFVDWRISDLQRFVKAHKKEFLAATDKELIYDVFSVTKTLIYQLLNRSVELDTSEVIKGKLNNIYVITPTHAFTRTGYHSLWHGEEQERYLLGVLDQLIPLETVKEISEAHKTNIKFSKKSQRALIRIILIECKLCKKWKFSLDEVGLRVHFRKKHPRMFKMILSPRVYSIPAHAYVTDASECVLCGMKFMNTGDLAKNVSEELIKEHIILEHCDEKKYKYLVDSVRAWIRDH